MVYKRWLMWGGTVLAVSSILLIVIRLTTAGSTGGDLVSPVISAAVGIVVAIVGYRHQP